MLEWSTVLFFTLQRKYAMCEAVILHKKSVVNTVNSNKI